MRISGKLLFSTFLMIYLSRLVVTYGTECVNWVKSDYYDLGALNKDTDYTIKVVTSSISDTVNFP